MNSADVLARQLERQCDSFIKVLRKVPEESLDWTPQPGMRSVRDQAQEVATIVTEFWELYADRKLSWDQERWDRYLQERANVHTVDQIEDALRGATAKLVEFVRSLPEAELAADTEMPWGGDHKLVDNITYHVWNMAYHEGQITNYLKMLGIETEH
jgi:uncharacterized damage-inducible protein DinB